MAIPAAVVSLRRVWEVKTIIVAPVLFGPRQGQTMRIDSYPTDPTTLFQKDRLFRCWLSVMTTFPSSLRAICFEEKHVSRHCLRRPSVFRAPPVVLLLLLLVCCCVVCGLVGCKGAGSDENFPRMIDADSRTLFVTVSTAVTKPEHPTLPLQFFLQSLLCVVQLSVCVHLLLPAAVWSL